jgi:hypothetical protein
MSRGIGIWGVVLFAGLGGIAGESWAEEQTLPASPTYRKPFLVRGRASVGGYMDMEFKANGDGSTFDQHRFVPFIFAEVSERVHVASEIEFEHGGFVSGSDETDGEIKIEFATLDFKLSEALNARGGVILSPLGRLNIFHDAPLLDLTERPLVNRNIIPTTLSEAGMGIYGFIYPSELVVIDYEAYLVNGFDGAAVDSGGAFNIRGARGSQAADNNNSRAFVGRLGVSPALGTEFGVSVHTGDYDAEGERNLTIAALDARWGHGPVELVGEGAMARGDYAAAGSGDEETAEAAGFYAEGRLHFLAGALRALPQSVFTGVVRFDYVDMNQNADGADQRRITFGLNFRPTEETVLKNDLLLDSGRGSGDDAWSDTETAYRFSMATYF